jgi:UDP-2,4-diacetamido-2,4,6-trideoxy-beta-L-altropyranose hydrolase
VADLSSINSSRPHALFRCDASVAIGAGHVTRCLALAEALSDAGWCISFAIRPGTTATVPELGRGSYTLHEMSGEPADEPAVLHACCPLGVDLLVVDHYERDIHFEKTCRRFARQILVLDDATGRRHICDFLVDAAATNRSVYAGAIPAQARLLLTPAYALMRRAFVEQRAAALKRRAGHPVENILVSLGATDPWNATSVALDALETFAEDHAITVALSSHAPHLDEVRAKLHGRMQLVLDGDMAKLMTDADLAIGAPGASSYERAVLGLPSIMVTLADNQRGIASKLSEAGAAIDAGRLDADLTARLGSLVRTMVVDAGARMRISKAASSMVDGRGGQRLLIELSGAVMVGANYSVRLRLADGDDDTWLLALQRAPQTRRHFRTSRVPSADEHALWMTRTLADQNVMLLVIEANYERAGYIRLDRLKCASAVCEISIAVRPDLHGRGVGSAALLLARRLQPGAIFDAEVQPENAASQALFIRAGFLQVREGRYRQRPVRRETV